MYRNYLKNNFFPLYIHSMPQKKYNGRKPKVVRKKKNAGLSNQEKQQVSKMIKGKRETFYLKTVQYCAGQVIEDSNHKNALSPQDCFQSGNKITMLGLTTAENLETIGQDVNSNSVHTSGDRLFITGGVRARDLGGVSGANLDGDMGYMKSHLQRLKIHASALLDENASIDKLIPLNFRVLVVQVNGNKPAGNLPSFTNVGTTGAPSLFRDSLDIKVGIDDQILPFEFTNNLRVDTKAFKVVRDIRFKLDNPILSKRSSGGAFASQRYNHPATKEIDLWLPQPKKPVRFNEGTQLPENYDYRYYTFVFCSADSVPNGLAMPTTENRWYLESTSIARVQEY